MSKYCLPLVTFLFLSSLAIAQEDILIEEEIEGEEEFVDYSNLVQTAENKAYCSPKVIGQTPAKLFSLGYDFQTAHSLQVQSFVNDGIGPERNIEAAQGPRLAINYPVYSKNHFLLTLGLNYASTQYSFTENIDQNSSPLVQSLDNNGLNTVGFTATGFKPLNSKHFLIFQLGANLNGDYSLANVQSLEYTRYTAAAIYGQKVNERKMWGVGVSRTYLGGALNYLPVYYMLYTAPSKKWGLEMLLPARFQYRRNLNAKNILTAGWEFEGNTFRINNDENVYDLPYNDLELRRSELRFRATWERALTSTIWLSLQAGYRYNWAFDVDRGDFFRPLGDDTPFLAQSTLTNPLYFNISINWVSP